ncbi:hypothetical protein WMY93_033519 [Mugilogobius chulae]|uniref:Uncharacterized protein n=1 Tax=Mugilogobius chulae TaxID=88201 RepID=A0AAW0MIJ5_9GOBI
MKKEPDDVGEKVKGEYYICSVSVSDHGSEIKYNPFAKAFLDAKERFGLVVVSGLRRRAYPYHHHGYKHHGYHGYPGRHTPYPTPLLQPRPQHPALSVELRRHKPRLLALLLAGTDQSAARASCSRPVTAEEAGLRGPRDTPTPSDWFQRGVVVATVETKIQKRIRQTKM